MRRSMWGPLVGATVLVGVLTGCEGAVELNASKRLAPDHPVVDAGLRTLARQHAQDACTAGAVIASPDPEAVYGPGSIELVDRELLDPNLDEPTDDHAATGAIWARFADDARLDTQTWDQMAAGQARCGDGYLYMTLVLRGDGTTPWAAGVKRVTSGNGAMILGGISADGDTVAFFSRSSNLVTGAPVPDVYLYDVPGDALTATGLQPGGDPTAEGFPGGTSGGVAITADGSTVFADEAAQTAPPGGHIHRIRAYDVASGTSTVRLANSDKPVFLQSVSADGSKILYGMHGGGGPTLLLDSAGVSTNLGTLAGFHYINSLSDDGQLLSQNGPGATVRTLASNTTQTAASNCYSSGNTPNGSELSADGRYFAFSCADQPAVVGDSDAANDVFVWDRTTRQSRLITSGRDGRGTSDEVSISDDGRFVAFAYDNPHVPSGSATYLWDRTTNRSTLIAPVRADVAVSGDGSTVAFTAVAPGQPDASINDLYVWDNPAA